MKHYKAFNKTMSLLPGVVVLAIGVWLWPATGDAPWAVLPSADGPSGIGKVGGSSGMGSPRLTTASSSAEARPPVGPAGARPAATDGTAALPPTAVAGAGNTAQASAAEATQQPGQDAVVDTIASADSTSSKNVYRDAQGRVGQAEWRNARVGPADVQVAAYPSGQLQPAESSRVDDPQLLTASMTLTTGDAVDRVVAFYRQQLQAGGHQFEEAQVSPDQWILGDVDGNTGVNRRVMVLRENGVTTVTVVRLQPRNGGG